MSKSKTYHLTPVGAIAVVGAIVCFLAAVGLASRDSVRLGSGGNEAPNVASAGAACGFGVACGLCVLAAAVTEAGSGRGKPAPPKETPPAPPTA